MPSALISNYFKSLSVLKITLGVVLVGLFWTSPNLLSGQTVMAKNKLNGIVFEINAKKRVKFKLRNSARLQKGFIEATHKDWIQINGTKHLLTDLIEIRSWSVKRGHGGASATGYLLTVGGALVTLLAVATLPEAGEGGYGDLTRGLGVTVGLLGVVSTYQGVRLLKRKAFFVAHWEFESLPTNP